MTFVSYADSSVIEKIMNKIVFCGAFYSRDANEELKKNFSGQTKLISLALKDQSYKEIQLEDYENATKNNKEFLLKDCIPCILASKNFNYNNDNGKSLVVYFGGNGETIYNSIGYSLFDTLNTKEVSEINSFKSNKKSALIDLLIVGYPGYACSGDEPSYMNFYKYSKALSDFFNESDVINQYKSIVFVLFSIGGAMGFDCASKVTNKKLIHIVSVNNFENLLTCVKHLEKTKYEDWSAMLDQALNYFNGKEGKDGKDGKDKEKNDKILDNLSRVKEIKIPIDIIFSENDEIVNNEDSKTLYKNIGSQKKNLWQIKGGHCEWDVNLVCDLIKNNLTNNEKKNSNGIGNEKILSKFKRDLSLVETTRKK